jgi:hypothetical protein
MADHDRFLKRDYVIIGKAEWPIAVPVVQWADSGLEVKPGKAARRRGSLIDKFMWRLPERRADRISAAPAFSKSPSNHATRKTNFFRPLPDRFCDSVNGRVKNASRREYSSLRVPSFLESTGDRSSVDPADFRPLSERTGFAVDNDLNSLVRHLPSATIERRFSRCAPSNVPGFVVAVVVDAIDHGSGWLRTNMGKESLEPSRAQPIGTNANAARAVVLPSDISRTGGAFFHGAPRVIGAGCHSTFRMTMGGSWHERLFTKKNA